MNAASYGAAHADVVRGTNNAMNSNVIAVGGGTHDERLALVGRVLAELDRAGVGAVCCVGLCAFLRGATGNADRREAAIAAAVKAVSP